SQFKHAAWLLGYLVFISIMSYCGSDGFGGQNWIAYPWDFLVIVIASLIFYKLAIDTGLKEIDPAAIKVNEKIKLEDE
ncbi:MAG: amino acid:proton symporter, partial [Lactobacillus sp.]|nr:amino acid:proton symporter [Lactobacillus sp.]